MRWYWWALIGLVVLSGGGYVAATQMTRGYRNKNPGNLKGGGKWRGLVGYDSEGFNIFDSDKNGIRALAIDLRGDYFKDGKKTVRALISEYAPKNENDTEGYIVAVAKKLNVKVDEVFDFYEKEIGLIKAIVAHENFLCKYSDDEINNAIKAI